MENGSNTLPKPVRKALGLEAGDTVSYVTSEGRVQVLKTRSVTELAGMLARDSQVPVSLGAMNEDIAQGVIEGGK
ncbi:AbrB/MazE/SpoVT family DNA-binding domain-containing protein [Rhodobacteraceae bacterium]|nr:AbrB/MazE/SpoVT family DNA-binding domain-containing protein [Paracoccaceae bacterium]